MKFRKLLFWSHLAVGLFVGLFVAFMAATGSILVFEPQIMRFAERRLLSTQSEDGKACINPGQLMLSVQQQTSRPVGTLELFSDRRLPSQVQFGKEDVLFVDPCTGNILQGSASQVRSFLTVVRNLHESAALGHKRSGVLRDLKNAANLGFFFLIMSGLILWLPRQWKRSSIRAVTTIRMNLRGRARDWNLHNVAGFWLAVPLLAITLTGAIMSYSWTEGLLYRVSGSPVPPPHDEEHHNSGGKTMEGSAVIQPTQRSSSVESRQDIPQKMLQQQVAGHPGNLKKLNDEAKDLEEEGHSGRRDTLSHPLSSVELLTLNPLIEIAKKQVPEWQSLRLQIAEDATQVALFTFDDDDEGQGTEKERHSELQINRPSGQILRWIHAEQMSRGQRWRTYARFLHTGQIFGLPGQVIALIATLSTLLLVWTGFALTIRRFAAWRARTLRSPAPKSGSLSGATE